MEHPDAFLETSYASFGARVIAFLIDLLIVAIVWFVVLVGIAMYQGGDELHLENLGFFLSWAGVGIAWEVLWIAGPARGKPGHRIVGARIVRPDGARVSVGRAVGRWVVRFATLVLFPFGLIAQFLTLAASRRNQGVHDVFVDTVCVKRADLEEARSVQHVPTASQLDAPTASPPPATRPSPIDRGGSDEAHNRGPFL
jgi:uncharacterized RDD family membrane protein YckC